MIELILSALWFFASVMWYRATVRVRQLDEEAHAAYLRGYEQGWDDAWDTVMPTLEKQP